MKTHDAAKVLQQLAKLLLSGPNVELSGAEIQPVADPNGMGGEQIAVNLTTLLQLSKIDKRQWAALVEEHQFPISIEPRDSSRNIIDKVLRFLSSNPEAADNLKRSASKKVNRGSSELSQALASLLGNKE